MRIKRHKGFDGNGVVLQKYDIPWQLSYKIVDLTVVDIILHLKTRNFKHSIVFPTSKREQNIAYIRNMKKVCNQPGKRECLCKLVTNLLWKQHYTGMGVAGHDSLCYVDNRLWTFMDGFHIINKRKWAEDAHLWNFINKEVTDEHT